MISGASVFRAVAIALFAPVGAMAAEAALVAKVNGEGIPESAFQRELKSAFVMRGILGSTAKRKGVYDAIRDEVLDRLVDEELLYQDAKRKDLLPDDAAVAERVSGLKASFRSPELYLSYLKKSFLDEVAIHDHTRRQMARENLLKREFADAAAVSENEIQNYYASHPEKFTKPEQVHARHVLIHAKPDAPQESKDAARKKIEEILGQVRAGADFAELARKHSECPSARKGGDLGYFVRGQMAGPFEDAAFGLTSGEVSAVVTTEYGYHIIKVEDHTAASVRSAADAAQEIRDLVASDKMSQVLKEHVKQLRGTAEIEIYLKADP